MTRVLSVPFVKMEGAGNDYVYLDNFALGWSTDRFAGLAASLADRHYGIGGDGLIVLQPPDAGGNVRMEMWNADGSRGATCGNGLRCVAKLAVDAGHVPGREMVIETDVGPRRAEIEHSAGPDGTAQVAIAMGAATVGEPATVQVDGAEVRFWPVDLGNQHAVVFLGERTTRDEFVALPVEKAASQIAALPLFGDGVNVEFVRHTGPSRVEQRTYERGSGETLACGSGAVAVAAAAFESGRASPPELALRLLGGELQVRATETGFELRGPARTVFRGEIVLADSG